MISISSASKLRQWQVWRTEDCAAKIRKFSISSDTLAAPANDMKNCWQLMNESLVKRQCALSPAQIAAALRSESVQQSLARRE
jgi:hypothetical protein